MSAHLALLREVVASPTSFKGSRTTNGVVVPYEAKRLSADLLDRIKGAAVATYTDMPNEDELEEALLAAARQPALVVERRMLVRGWKMERGERREFTAVHFYSPGGYAIERARIGEELPGWQPHVTEVVVEERYVTPWARVR